MVIPHYFYNYAQEFFANRCLFVKTIIHFNTFIGPGLHQKFSISQYFPNATQRVGLCTNTPQLPKKVYFYN